VFFVKLSYMWHGVAFSNTARLLGRDAYSFLDEEKFMRMKNYSKSLHRRGSGALAVVAAALASLVSGAHTVHAAPAGQTLVVCSPGSPGTTDEAQPRMDALAKAVTARAGTSIAVVYDPTDDGGVTRLKAAGLGMVSLPFFLQHEQELGLHARLQAVAKGRPALERWALVTQKGRVKAADGLAGFTLVSSVAFAPAFVRGTALGGFGALPANVKLTQSSAVLSALRHAADGDATAVLLDATQEASLASLPFAAKLEVVTRSPALPVGLVVTIDARLPDKAWAGISNALLGLSSDKAAATALDALQLTGFVALDDKALAAARKAFADATTTK
jgi:hypothetical protein